MTHIMRDSVVAGNIPITGTDIAAGYLDGSFNTWAALRNRFPGVPKVAIDVDGSAPGAQVRDWETGDKSGDLRQWVIDHNAFNKNGVKDAVIYCNRSTIAEVRRLTGDQILGKDYFLWIATLDKTIYGPTQLKGVLACQTWDFGPFDESIVWPTAGVWWTGAPVPVNPAKTAIVIDGFTVGRPSATNVPCVVSWFGDAGLTRRFKNIPQSVWKQIP